MNALVLPIRHTVLFPDVVLAITVAREKSIALIESAKKAQFPLAIFSQKNNKITPNPQDLYEVGTLGRVVRIWGHSGENTTVVIRGTLRIKIDEYTAQKPHLRARVSPWRDASSVKDPIRWMRILHKHALRWLELSPEASQHLQRTLNGIDDLAHLVSFLCTHLPFSVVQKQRLLAAATLEERAKALLQLVQKEIQQLGVKEEIANKVYSDIEQQQRNYFLKQQMRVLQDELGMGAGTHELEALAKKARHKRWPKEVAEHFNREMNRTQHVVSGTPEYSVAFNYLEFMVDLPWDVYTKVPLELTKVRRVLDRHHYGIDRVKDRIVEYLAVLMLRKDMKAPILCFSAPPGVGKTTLGQSIARALGRKCAVISLGGLHDEAEIRGHRRTYIGAMPGKIMNNILKMKTSNPVIILDEIDKVGHRFHGDPSSSLLEVLDPEQNGHFVDNYLEVGYDLSQVFFIATANTTSTIQPALLDRMEVVELAGYTEEEKVKIASKHLIPKLRKAHGLQAKQVRIPETTLRKIIAHYTRESGVRTLGRRLADVMRRTVKAYVLKEAHPTTIPATKLRDILGIPQYEEDPYQHIQTPGISVGLAWTPYGGEVLFVESVLYKGKGKLTLSGQLGDVMKESAQASFSYLRSVAKHWEIVPSLFEERDLHLHVPSGAIPKDGPSAGITMLTAMTSVYTQRCVKKDLAMTGEITLSGKVLPVGGIKEKLLAARARKIKEVIVSRFNRKDVEDLDDDYTKHVSIHYIETAHEVLSLALL